jgi:hypothetical protein
MSFLKEAVNYIRNSFLTEASSQDVYNEIVSAVNAVEPSNERNSAVSGLWVAGLMKGLMSNDSNTNMLLAAYRGNRLDPESKEYRDARRILAALQVLRKYNLVTSQNDQFYLNKDKREVISKFLARITQYSHDAKDRKDLAKNVRSAEYGSDQEWYDNLSSDQKHAVQLIKDMDLKDIALLNRLVSKKESKKSYVDLIQQLEIRGNQSVDKFKAMGIINDDNTLNSYLLSSLDSIINDPQFETRLKFINRTMRDKLYRSAADKALNLSALAKNVLDTDFGRKALSLIDGPLASDIEDLKKVFGGATVKKSLLIKLKKFGLVDAGNGLTDLGKAVSALIKKGYSKADYQDVRKGVNYSGMRPSEDSIVRDRLNKRAADRKSEISNIIRRNQRA